MKYKQTPVARRTGIVTKKLDNEMLVYDLDRHQAHCLNQNAALIWGYCDGVRTVSDLCSLLNTDQGTTAHQKEQMIWIALTELDKAGLLNEPIMKPETIKGLTRRQLIKAAGVAALVAIPVVGTMMAPTASEASTCLATGQPCISSADCCSGVCDVTCV
jgi:hypothetical protein